MAISDTPNAVEKKSRRETSGVQASPVFFGSIACSLINKIEKQNGRRILAPCQQRGWTPLSLGRIFRLPPGRH
ncbi:MAG: hypothetical protein ACK4FP_07210 [Azonexus sp.]